MTSPCDNRLSRYDKREELCTYGVSIAFDRSIALDHKKRHWRGSREAVPRMECQESPVIGCDRQHRGSGEGPPMECDKTEALECDKTEALECDKREARERPLCCFCSALRLVLQHTLQHTLQHILQRTLEHTLEHTLQHALKHALQHTLQQGSM